MVANDWLTKPTFGHNGVSAKWNELGFWEHGCGCVQYQDSWERCKEHIWELSVKPNKTRPASLPTNDKDRKSLPVFDGTFGYFPDALIEVARVSVVGNDQHHKGEPLHWDRSKSTDQRNTAFRHFLDHHTGTTKDSDGTYHLAKGAWRILAELQLLIEKDRQ